MSTEKFQKETYSKDMVRQSFDVAAQDYNQYTSLQRLIGDHLLLQETTQRQPFQRVLDIGAGTGYVTKKLSQRGNVNDVYALDIAQSMLNQARHHLGAGQATGFICADAEKMPLTDNVFDAIYSNLAFQWCENLEGVFSQAYRALCPDGSFVFSTFGPKTLIELKESWGEADEAVHVNSFVAREIIQRNLEAAGFKNISIEAENKVVYYDSPKQLMLDLKGMGAHNMNRGRRVGLTGVHAFKAMLHAYEKLRTKQGVPATFEAVYVVANKNCG
ncbi:MAG: malonyl-ACP O-methyltransferase BioC [Cycloclasticus sp.]